MENLKLNKYSSPQLMKKLCYLILDDQQASPLYDAYLTELRRRIKQ